MSSKLKDTLLLVGSEIGDRKALREIFQSAYNLLEAEGSQQAELLLAQNGDCIAAVLADMPLTNSQDVRDLILSCHTGMETEIPVLLIISPSGTGEREEKAFDLGATDVIYKPYTAPAIQRRVQIVVDFFLHKWHLEEMVTEQRETIRNANQVMVDTLSALIEHRNTESGNHVLRIRRFTQVLLEEVARSCPEYGLTQETIDIISSASALHDIGKIAIPDAILNKPARLTPEEFEVMKTHTIEGAQMVEQLSGMGDAQYLRYAYNIALYHHERWDGNGYPHGLDGDTIPICAQAVGLADVFDALTSERVYKDAFACGKAINMILNGECGTFSPKLLACFKQVRNQFVELGKQYARGYSPKSDQIKAPLPGPQWKSPSLNTLQISQVKYQALLHYMDDTVLEVDLDNGVYHVVYNPNPDLDALVFNGLVRDVGDLLRGPDIHPDDRGVLDVLKEFVERELFLKNARRRSFCFRLLSPTRKDYQPYELTLMRVNTGDEGRRVITAIWHRIEEGTGNQNIPARSSLHAAPALYGLVSSALRCRNDGGLTIDAGAEDLLPLAGYTGEEIGTEFDNSLTALVAEEDREEFCRKMDEHRNVGGRAEMEFRIRHKERGSVWVLAKSRIYVESDGQEYVYFAIRDNSQSKAVQQEMKETIARDRIIIEQTGSISFEWDIKHDLMTISPLWQEHFGYTPVTKNYGAQLGIATHFHPDDVHLVRRAVANIKSGGETSSAEVRIANGVGKYLWCRITATGVWSQSGELDRIVGVIQDIDDLKRANIVLKERAERDALTKLLNKASTQQLINEYLAERFELEQAALLVLDLDNFKTVNDSYGHLYGDAFLTRVGTTLRRLFRSNDIIGRVGGDEFVVMMRDVPSEEMVRERCGRLLAAFRELFEDMTPDLNVSFSVGVVMIPDHGVKYSDLFQRADEALYLAKSQGKDDYEMYDPANQFKPLLENTRTNTDIDSDEQPGIANDSFAQFVFRWLYESKDFHATIDQILAYIGEEFNVSRVYIFENNEDNTTCSNTFEWCNKGITPEKDNLQNISYIDDIAGWPEVYDERGVLYCPDVRTLEPHIRAVLEPQGIKSMLQCAIMDNGVFRGYVGFDECTVNRMWTREQVDLLTFLAEVLAVFLINRSNQERAERQAENLQSVLDRQDAWIYVIDPESCELKFLNAKARDIAPNTRLGMTCYQAFMGRDSRCENCPAARIKEEQNTAALIRNDNLNVSVRSRASLISWNGEDACLLTCHDLAKE